MDAPHSDDTGDAGTLELTAPHRALQADGIVDELAETGEFPPLDLARMGTEADGAAAAGAQPPAAADERASYWLKHLETEIVRLQHKWEVVAEELRGREAQIEKLEAETHGKDRAAEALRAELAERSTAAQKLQDELAAASRQIAELVAAAAERDRATHDLEAKLAAAAVRDRTQLDELAALTAKATDLGTRVEDGRAEIARIEKQRVLELDASNELRVKIQELEAYIDGRSRSWSSLNAQLATDREQLATLETALAAARAELAAVTADRDRLTAVKQTLERSSHDLAARGETLEAARAELEKTAAAHLESLEAMRARHAEEQRAKEEQQAEVERRAAKIATLEAAVAARDRAVGDLEKALESSRAEHAELGAEHAALAARATDLERELASRAEKIASLEGAATAAAREAAHAEQQLADYEQRMHAAAHEIASLQDEIAARDQLIERLKTDLHAKQDALDLLERNVQRLNEIGASLEGLDKRFSTNSILSARLQPVPRAEAAAADRAMSPPSVERGSTAAPTPSDAHARRLIIALDGDQRRTYPLDGAVLTIGRGADSDIRIQSPFVSRTHARILLREGATLIEDLDSKNGILVNSKAIDRTVALHDGDIISLGGQLELKYVDLDRRNGSAARH